MRKKFKVKRKFKLNKTIFFLLIFLILFLFNYISKNIELSALSNINIKYILELTNKYSYKEKENTNVINKAYQYLKNNIFNTPINLLKSELKYEGKKEDVLISALEQKEEPLVYIYNSHQAETYSMEYLENYNIEPNVLMASNILKDKLKEINIDSEVEESDILTYMKKNNLDHSGSYKASRYFLVNAINNYPTVDLFIDLHRDAASHEVTTTTINEKKCAKVLFVIGLEYDTYAENLSIVTKINNIILNKYPTLTRGIMKKKGYGVNGIYNQDLSSNVILIEIGGHENNIEEVNNTLEIIAMVIGEYLNEKK